MTRCSAVPYFETMALKTRTALPAAALLVAAVLGVSACGGGGVPGNSVATVGDETIKRDTFDHWMKIIAISQAGQTNPAAAKTAKVPDAPDFKQCIADKKKTAPKPAKGQPEPTDASLKTQCQQQYAQFRDQVLGFLIRSTWLDQEANRLKVKVADKAKAAQAKKALDSGQSWKSVAKKYSVDQASKSKGGLLAGVAKGQQEPAFDKAIFAAKKGKLTGPVKTQFGWYVFEVSKIAATKQQTLDESKTSIKQILASQNQQNALKKFGDDYR